MKNDSTLSALIRSKLVSVLNRTPPVLASFDSDFEKNLSAFSRFAAEYPGTVVLLQLGYEHETPALARQLTEAVSQFKGSAPRARVIILCNYDRECSALGDLGNEIRLIHQNCFLDERRYCPLPGKKIYDAVYLARLTPCKRHELIPPEMAPRLLLMGTYAYRSEHEYSDMVHQRYAAAKWVGFFSGAKISLYLANARCGLILSAREGASFCSSEYLMCGLPIVDTPAIGGRSVLYPEEYVKFVDATTDAVGAGVEYWATHPTDPARIRAAWLAKAEPHRAEYRKLMRDLTGKTPTPIHKLGLRTPHPGGLYSHAIRMYLAIQKLRLKIAPER